MTAPKASPLAGVKGAGLGLRRDLIPDMLAGVPEEIGFFEVAPENWMEVGGRRGREFRALTERHPFVTHGLSLSLGSPAPLDTAFVRRIGKFLDQHQIRYYTEHLSYCSDDGHLYDLMPIPFTEDAVKYVAARIRRVQDVLGREIAVENVSYYAAPSASAGDKKSFSRTPAAAPSASAGGKKSFSRTPAAAPSASAGGKKSFSRTSAAAPGTGLTELEFLNAVLEEANCGLLLDVNNIYVNSINHRYDPHAFLAGVPAGRVRYLHVAGHYEEAPDLRVDTHGADVCDPVWTLLEQTYARLGPLPTLLERDFNIPPLPELLGEIRQIRQRQAGARA